VVIHSFTSKTTTRGNLSFLRVFSSAVALTRHLSTVHARITTVILLSLGVSVFSGCGTTDKARLKESRAAYLKDDFSAAETALYTADVFKNSQNRLVHFYFLASVAMSESQFEKAAYFLNRAREIATQVRSDSGTFDWFSTDYRSNPVEFSYIHYMTVMSYTMLAESGQTSAWGTPEIKDDKGVVMVRAQNFPARKYDAREISDYRQKARSELMAWDSFLQNLRQTYPEGNYYKEDLWARLLASYVHGISSDGNERRTADLLTDDARKVFEKEFGKYPSSKTDGSQVKALIERMKKRSEAKSNTDSLFVFEAGIMPKYKIKRFHLGLSTIVQNIQDPALRGVMERVGLQVLLSEAPEFGLIAVGGAVAGAVSGGTHDDDDEFEGPPHYFSDAVDRSLGFEIRFPTMVFPPADTQVKLSLVTPGRTSADYALPIVSPLQEIVATEIKTREGKEMFAKALKIGGEYIAVLVPAIVSYKQASRENNLFKKLAILAGYYIAKKAIDAANSPDLRSWDTLPQVIAANLINTPAGDYDAKVTIENQFGHFEQSLGKLTFGTATTQVVRQRVGDVPILDRRDPGQGGSKLR
jgi:hypothetical protein